MTLQLDIMRLMLIVLGMGAAGLPLAFWLLRDGFSKVEKILMGFTLGVVLIPALFLFETLVGLKYNPALIAVHWALLLAVGAALWVREIAASKNGLAGLLKAPVFKMQPGDLENALPSALLALLLIVSVIIPLSSAGGLLSEIDPYFYLDGVQQVVNLGGNIPNDGTAWYPTLEMSHLGQPLFKFLIASWYSIYAQGAAYSPYLLASVASVYPPIMMGLAVFFMYWLFRELYHPRAGLLAGGLLAFMPVMLTEMGAGKTQITPYNIFALLFFLAMFYSMVKRRTPLFCGLAILAYATLLLGSNIESLLIFCLSLFLGMVGFLHFVAPRQESRELLPLMGAFFGGMALVQLVLLTYYQTPLSLAWIKALAKSVLLPALAFGIPVLAGYALDKYGPKTKHAGAHGAKAGTGPAPLSLVLLAGVLMMLIAVFHLFGALVVLPLILFFLFLDPITKWIHQRPDATRLEFAILLLGGIALAGTIAPDLPVIGELFDAYRSFGAYATAVTRTIAEQAAGLSSFDSSFGVSALSFGDAPTLSNAGEQVVSYIGLFFQNLLGFKLLDAMLIAIAWINILPTLLLNAFYNTAAAFMNIYLAKDGVTPDFPIVERVDSLATLFFFFGPLLLAYAVWRSVRRDGEEGWPYGALLMLAFIVPITFMGFMKVKLLIFLAIAFVFSLTVAWAEGERLFKAWMDGRSKQSGRASWMDTWPVHPRHLAWFLVLLAVLLQLGWPTYLFIDATTTLSSSYTQAYAQGAAILTTVGQPTFYQNPAAAWARVETACKQYGQSDACAAVADRNATLSDPTIYYNSNLCYISLLPNLSSSIPQSKSIGYSYRCAQFAGNWLEAYEWMRRNVTHGERVTSWWDYGHWTNYFGGTYSVLDPTQASGPMIGHVAYAYAHADAKTLREIMKRYGSRYALMDMEIVGSTDSNGAFIFGNKFSALNYLGCDWANRTNVSSTPMNSVCELENQPEQVVVPTASGTSTSCTVSEATQSKGQVGYRVKLTLSGQGILQTQTPAYCVRDEQTTDGQSLGVYFLNQKDDNGDLLRSPAYWVVQSTSKTEMTMDALYTKEAWPLANGTIASRWDYRQGPYYDTSLYQGFFLRQLDGFDLVYDSSTIRIYKMQDAYWNNQTD